MRTQLSEEIMEAVGVLPQLVEQLKKAEKPALAEQLVSLKQKILEPGADLRHMAQATREVADTSRERQRHMEGERVRHRHREREARSDTA